MEQPRRRRRNHVRDDLRRRSPASCTADEVHTLFSDFGVVDRVSLVSDYETGRSRGLGFVEMSSGADEAIRRLDRRRVGGNRLRVKVAVASWQAGHTV